MNKVLLIIIFLTNTILFVHSQPNYANGNGTIINVENIENTIKTLRLHSQRFQIGNNINARSLRNENLYVYVKPEKEENGIISELFYGDFINIEQILEVIIENNYLVWLNISKDNGINGWVFFGEYEYKNAESRVPYINNRWEIIEHININNRNWAIRNMNNQTLSTWNKIDIMDNPGLIGTEIISQIIPPKDALPVQHFNVIAATEETEIIDGINDRWLKINYNGIEGWVFGGYVSAERGGEKYYTPEIIIFSQLGTVINIK
jgi:hypothetical protein